MITKKFIENQSEAKRKLQSLTLFQSDTDEFDEIYIDSDSNQKWEKYQFEYEDQMTYGIGLRNFPYPSIDETIEIALSSKFKDEVAGASALLYELDREGQEIRKPLLKSIEQIIPNISKDRFETIYWRTKIHDKTNNREIMGKNLSEIEADYAYYIQTAEHAEILREKTTTANKL